jgi:hypothetical protein
VQRAMRGINPCLEMRQLGFGPLLLIKSFSVNMSGARGWRGRAAPWGLRGVFGARRVPYLNGRPIVCMQN